MKKQWLAVPLCIATALTLSLNGNIVVAAESDDLNADGVKLRGDGSIDDSQPGAVAGSDDIVDGVKLRGDGSVDDSQPGAAPVVNVETTVNEDGTTTVTRSVSLSATGEAPNRSRSTESTFDADGALVGRTRTDVRTNADGVVVRERTTTLERVDGEMVRTRSDIRRNDAGDIVRSRERIETRDRPEIAGVERIEKIERRERADRPDRIERREKIERRERPERSGRD